MISNLELPHRTEVFFHSLGWRKATVALRDQNLVLNVGDCVEERFRELPDSGFVFTRPFTDWHVHTSLVGVDGLESRGIQRVLDLGSNPDRVQILNKSTARNAPRVSYAGAFLTAAGGYPSDRLWAEKGSIREINSVSQIEDAVLEMKRKGANLIKTTLNTEAGPTFDDDTLQEIVRLAKFHRLPVVVHAEGMGQAKRARESGASILAHTPFSEALSDEEIELQAQEVVWMSTMDIHGHGKPTEFFYIALDNLQRFHAAGGKILYATDMGNGPTVNGLNHRELHALKQAGLNDSEIIESLVGCCVNLLSSVNGMMAIQKVEKDLNFMQTKYFGEITIEGMPNE